MDILILKVSTGELMTQFRANQNYTNVYESVVQLLLRYHPGKTAAAYALCDAMELQAQIDAGKNFIKGDPNGGGDFDICKKSEVGNSRTIILPTGLKLENIQSDDDVVCYA